MSFTSTFTVKVDRHKQEGWCLLVVADRNGIAFHTVLAREVDLPQEIASAIERGVMSRQEAPR